MRKGTRNILLASSVPILIASWFGGLELADLHNDNHLVDKDDALSDIAGCFANREEATIFDEAAAREWLRNNATFDHPTQSYSIDDGFYDRNIIGQMTPECEQIQDSIFIV